LPHCLLHSFPTRRSSDLLPNLEELNLKPVSASNRGKWAMSLVGIVLLLWTTAKAGAQVETAREAARDVIRVGVLEVFPPHYETQDRKSTRLNSSHVKISY